MILDRNDWAASITMTNSTDDVIKCTVYIILSLVQQPNDKLGLGIWFVTSF